MSAGTPVQASADALWLSLSERVARLEARADRDPERIAHLEASVLTLSTIASKLEAAQGRIWFALAGAGAAGGAAGQALQAAMGGL